LLAMLLLLLLGWQTSNADLWMVALHQQAAA
jgi:hypothetical protein